MRSENSEKNQLDELYREASRRAKKSLRKRYPNANEADIEDVIQEALAYVAMKEATEARGAAPVNGSDKAEEDWFEMVIERAHERYLNLVRDENLREEKYREIPPTDEIEYERERFQLDLELKDFRESELDLEEKLKGQHSQKRKRARQKFVDKYIKDDPEV